MRTRTSNSEEYHHGRILKEAGRGASKAFGPQTLKRELVYWQHGLAFCCKYLPQRIRRLKTEGGLVMTCRACCPWHVGQSANDPCPSRMYLMKKPSACTLVWTFWSHPTAAFFFHQWLFLSGSVPAPEEPSISNERRSLIGGQGQAEVCHG